MSADNGMIVRKTATGQFEVKHYFASSDEDVDDIPNMLVFNDLEAAMQFASKQETEYGVTYIDK